jgi:hypothetical protein
MVDLRSPRFNKPMDAPVQHRKALERQQMIQYLNRPKELLSVAKAKYQIGIGEDVDCNAEEYYNEIRPELEKWMYECKDAKEVGYVIIIEIAIKKLDRKFKEKQND